jgi:hypothetical protein
MLKLLGSRFSNKNLMVNLDRRLVASIVRNNGELTDQTISIGIGHNIRINLLKLITSTATVQTRRINPTRFNKLFEKSDLLDYIRGCDDFCVIKHPDSDKQRTLSEDLGVGLSVLVTDHYYKINWTTLGKIPRRQESEPDIACMSISKESITIEAKGSISDDWRNQQITYALHQKRGPTPSHVCVASCALLKENSISDVEYFDPPLIPPEDAEYEKSLLKADHYARIFNLIGQEELSRYFGYMRQRVMHDRDFRQFDKKQELYEKIKTKYVRIRVKEQEYFGNIEKQDDESLFFVGVDGRLLNVYNFILFEGHEDSHINIDGDDFYLSSDGLCIALLKSLQSVKDQITYDQIPHLYDSFSIIDFDYSRESTLVNYLSHIIRKVGGKVQQERSLDWQYDLLFSLDDKKFAVEIKRYISTKDIESIRAMFQQLPLGSQFKFVLITNTRLSENISDLIRSRNIILIDRTGLREIIKNNKTILDHLRQR